MTDLTDIHPRAFYVSAMDRPPIIFPERDLAAEAAALDRPQMFDCTRMPGATRISERQCLINQARAAASGFPSFCLECPKGGEIKTRHPEGMEIQKRRHAGPGDHSCAVAGKSIDVSIDPSVKETAAAPQPPALCAKHGMEKLREKRGRYYCPKCRGEAHLGGIPICPVHQVKKTADARGRYFCSKCKVAGQRRSWDRKKEKKMALGPSTARAGEKAKEIPYCPQHPAEKQLRDERGEATGLCPKCLPLQKVQIARPGVNLPPLTAAKAGAGEVPVASKRSKPGARSLEALFLAKLPEFDAAWGEDLKIEWLKAFRELVSLEQEPPPPRSSILEGEGEEKSQAGRQVGTLTLITPGGRP